MYVCMYVCRYVWYAGMYVCICMCDVYMYVCMQVHMYGGSVLLNFRAISQCFPIGESFAGFAIIPQCSLDRVYCLTMDLQSGILLN